ncbi:MAG: lamin tail domain-containing protein [Anaerolineales bacterium]|nr:lamin tail domain-containing protein [Anaerolineales bacterium]
MIFYILMNIFVSACVTGSILFWYDRNYRTETVIANLPAASEPADKLSTSVEEVEGTTAEGTIEIVSVVGVGTLNAEVVVIRYTGDEELGLAGWRLQDENGNKFDFPQLVLYKNGAVQLHTASGTNTVVDLYWGLRNPVWESGEVARLYDNNGDLRAVYTIP